MPSASNSIPIITLNSESQIRHEATTEFTDPGATVKDGEGNDLDAVGLVVTGTVDPSVLGLQVLTYIGHVEGSAMILPAVVTVLAVGMPMRDFLYRRERKISFFTTAQDLRNVMFLASRKSNQELNAFVCELAEMDRHPGWQSNGIFYF